MGLLLLLRGCTTSSQLLSNASVLYLPYCTLHTPAHSPISTAALVQYSPLRHHNLQVLPYSTTPHLQCCISHVQLTSATPFITSRLLHGVFTLPSLNSLHPPPAKLYSRALSSAQLIIRGKPSLVDVCRESGDAIGHRQGRGKGIIPRLLIIFP